MDELLSSSQHRFVQTCNQMSKIFCSTLRSPSALQIDGCNPICQFLEISHDGRALRTVQGLQCLFDDVFFCISPSFWRCDFDWVTTLLESAEMGWWLFKCAHTLTVLLSITELQRKMLRVLLQKHTSLWRCSLPQNQNFLSQERLCCHLLIIAGYGNCFFFCVIQLWENPPRETEDMYAQKIIHSSPTALFVCPYDLLRVRFSELRGSIHCHTASVVIQAGGIVHRSNQSVQGLRPAQDRGSVQCLMPGLMFVCPSCNLRIR